MNGAVTFRTLKYKLDYSHAIGGFRGLSKEVDCDRNIGGFSAFTDFDASKVLATTLFNEDGVLGPRKLAHCTFATTETSVAPSDFVLAVTDARSPNDTPVNPDLEIRVACGATTSTSTSSSVEGGTTTTV